MLKTVKLNIHDWPKRGAFKREEVDVDANDDVEAIQLGLLKGQQLWPGGKVKAYDVVKSRYADALHSSTALTNTLIGDTAPLVMAPEKRGPGRPRKVAV